MTNNEEFTSLQQVVKNVIGEKRSLAEEIEKLRVQNNSLRARLKNATLRVAELMGGACFTTTAIPGMKRGVTFWFSQDESGGTILRFVGGSVSYSEALKLADWIKNAKIEP